MTYALCSIPDCDKVALTRGWCSMHYTRWKRTGDPLMVRGSQRWHALTAEEFRQVSTRVDTVATPLTMLALFHLFTTREESEVDA